jgi:hypothetical protein
MADMICCYRKFSFRDSSSSSNHVIPVKRIRDEEMVAKMEEVRIKLEGLGIRKGGEEDDAEMQGVKINDEDKVRNQDEDVKMEDPDHADDEDRGDDVVDRTARRGVPFLPEAAFLKEWRMDSIDDYRMNRTVTDGDGTWNRFVTDCERSSGRIYDRLNRMETVRLIPCGFDGSGKPAVFDVLTGAFRARTMMDDMRRSSEGQALEISQEEYSIHYKMVEG